MAIRIANIDALVRIFRTISWLDDRRWYRENNHDFINFFRKNLSNCEKIFTLWICCITNRQMPYETVFDKGGYVFSQIAHEYIARKLPLQSIFERHYERYKSAGKRKYRFKSSESGNTIYFASRYITYDYQNLLQTLQILDRPKYKRNILFYIADIISKHKGQKDLLTRIACGLHLLTYRLTKRKAKPKRILDILGSQSKFEKELRIFKKNSTEGKKRLWCCIRDYKKGLYHRRFKAAVRDTLGDDAKKMICTWNDLPMDQIELPGDVWNNNPIFRETLMGSVIDTKGIPGSWSMPRIIRNVYKQVKCHKKLNDFYPEQFDTTFDFIPRMCSRKLCRACLFSRNGVDLICIPSQGKLCPVALVSCGYTTKCTGESGYCIIRKERISKGLCREIR